MELIKWVIESTTIIYVWVGIVEEKIVLELIQNTSMRHIMALFKGVFKGLDKHFSNIRRLRSNLDALKKYPFNTNHEHYLNGLDRLQLVNYSKFPQGIEEKINRYNKRSADLSDLFLGCDRFVQDMVIKNSLEYLHGIEIIRDNNGQIIPWELGYDGNTKLSQLLAYVLKVRILKGEEINKTLFDSIDSKFYDTIKEKAGKDAFFNFLRNLNQEIEIQEMYGCLKLFKRCYSETNELVDDLLSEVNKYRT